jgi:uncharacterized protein (TIGR03085 family)
VEVTSRYRAGMTLAQTERAALADLFVELGPEQPTLCEGWDTGDLLAHLLIRERQVFAAAGTWIKPLEGLTARVSAGYSRRPWTEQIEMYRAGPPGFSPFAWGSLDEKGNGMEMFIHHEDARRGQPDWQPRALDEATKDQLLRMITSALVLHRLKKIGVPVTARLLDEPGQRDMPIVLVPSKKLDIVNTPPGVVLHGGVGEILLWLSGRSEVRIDFEGATTDVAAVRAGGGRPAGR